MPEQSKPIRRGSMPAQMRSAQIVPDSWDEEGRTIDLVWTTGAAVRRFDYWDGVAYDEVLLVSPEAVDLSRLNAGAQVLDAHQQWELRNIIGVVESAWLENGEGWAKVRFSARPDIEPLIADIRAGIIRSVSVGYIVTAWQVEKADGQVERRTAVRWVPAEISFVPVPADAGAGTRAGQTGVVLHPCEYSGLDRAIEKEVSVVADENENPVPVVENRANSNIQNVPSAPAAQVADPAAVIQGERARITGIQGRAAALNLDGDFVTGLIDDGVPLDAACTRMIDEVARRAGSPQRPSGLPSVQGGADFTDPDNVRERMVSAIVARAGGGTMPDNAREFAGMSVLEMGAELAVARGATGMGRRMSAAVMYDRLSERGQHTTSDFPLLMTGASRQVLLVAYGRAAPTFKLVMGQRNLPDFKESKMLRVGDFPGLVEVGESGEFKYGTVGESNETIVLSTFGRILGISRQAIINDELGAFAQVLNSVAGRVARFENSFAWTVVDKNPKLSDGKAIFHADHGNTAAFAAIDETSISVGETAIMMQKDMDGGVLNLSSRFLITPPALKVSAKKAVAAITPATAADFNTYAGELEVVTEANLNASSWYLAADPAMAPAFVYSYLEGLEGPRLSTREGFTTDGMEWKVAIDFAVGAVDGKPWHRRRG